MEERFQKEIFEKLQSWICNHTNVVNPPLKNGHINTKSYRTIEVIKLKITNSDKHHRITQRLNKTYIRGWFWGSGSESVDVIIEYSYLRRYIPPQVK